MDIKQLIPSPPPAAIYNIFRSCLNELVRSHIVDTFVEIVATTSSTTMNHHPPSSPPVPGKSRASSRSGQNDPPLLSSKKTKRSSARTSSSIVGRTSPATTRVSPPAKRLRLEQIAWDRCVPLAVPTYLQLRYLYLDKPQSYGGRVWALAEKCVGFSGRTLRRLPILALAMYTWGGECSLHDAISALESAVEQELKAKSE